MDIKSLQFWTTKSKPWLGNIPGKKVKKEGDYYVYEFPEWDGYASFTFIQNRLDEGQRNRADCFCRATMELKMKKDTGEIDHMYVGDYFRITTELPTDAYLATPKDASIRIPLATDWKVTPVAKGIPSDVIPYLYANYHGVDLTLNSDKGVIPEILEVEAFFLTIRDRQKIHGMSRTFYGGNDTVGKMNRFLCKRSADQAARGWEPKPTTASRINCVIA